MPWKRKKVDAASGLPWGISPQDIAALRALRASPQWAHYLKIVDQVAESQATEFVTGLSHERYLFACGALSTFRRVYTLVDDLIETATRLENATNDRTRRAAAADLTSDPFVNTSWWGSERSPGRREH